MWAANFYRLLAAGDHMTECYVSKMLAQIRKLVDVAGLSHSLKLKGLSSL